MSKKTVLYSLLGVLVVAIVAVAAVFGSEGMGLIFKVDKTPTLTVSLSPDSPPTSMLVAKSQDQLVAKFKFTAANDSITVKSLSLNCTGLGLTSVPNNADNLISYIRVSSGNVSKVTTVTNGVALVDGLGLGVRKGNSVEVSVIATLNTIYGGAHSGGYFRFSVGDVVAVGITSPTSVKIVKSFNSRNAVESKNMYVYETKPTLTLNASSPSGPRSVATSDKVLVFDVGADAAEKVKIEKMKFSMASDKDFAINSSVPAYLKNGDAIVATGTVKVNTDSYAEVELLPVSDWETPWEVTKGNKSTYSLVLNTTDLLDDDAGVDDPFGVCLLLSVSPDLEGGFWWNDTNSTVKWLDMFSLSRVSLMGGGLANFCSDTINY